MRARRRERLAPALAVLAFIVIALIAHASLGGDGARHTHAGGVPRLAIQRVLREHAYISRGTPRHREVALTFDDGPGPATRQILHVLHRYGAPATFFQVGRMVRSFPLLAREEVADGHAAGLHTNNHPRLLGRPLAFQRAETDPANDEIPGYAPNFMHLFRPPYGAFGKKTLTIMKERHTLVVLWSLNTFDYLQPGVKVIVRRAVKGAFPGAIVLMHDAGGFSRAETVRALPKVIEGLRRRHFKLVTVPRMLMDGAPPREQPRAVGPG